jgi:hypothetical protein
MNGPLQLHQLHVRLEFSGFSWNTIGKWRDDCYWISYEKSLELSSKNKVSLGFLLGKNTSQDKRWFLLKIYGESLELIELSSKNKVRTDGAIRYK